PTVKYERWWHVPVPGSDFIDAMSILGILHQARDGMGASAVTLQELRQRTRIGLEEAERLLQRMQEAGWGARVKSDTVKRRPLGLRSSDNEERWVLLAHTDQLKLSDVYRLFVFSPHDKNPVAQKVEGAMERGLDESLFQYFTEEAPVKAGAVVMRSSVLSG